VLEPSETHTSTSDEKTRCSPWLRTHDSGENGSYYDPMVKMIFINGLYYKPMVKIIFAGFVQTGGENALGENDFFSSDIILHFVCASMMC
jgi:hypothetical protein